MNTEKTVTKQLNNGFIKERFSFELTVNDNIICQRYFRINGFKSHSLHSEELLNTLNYCADIIKDDLKNKSRMFYWYTAPAIFKNEESMWEWYHNRPYKIDDFRYICLEDSDQVYFWDGTNIEPYNKFYNKSDYMCTANNETEQSPCLLKLSFLDNDKVVCSTSWDGNIYPRFIRTNIDLSNSKNKYKQDGVFCPMEYAMVGILNETHEDLIPIIVKEFCVCCSMDGDDSYTDAIEYGDKIYSLNIDNENYRNVVNLEKKLKKKTNKYFSTFPSWMIED